MNAISAPKDIWDKVHSHWSQLSVPYHKPYCTFMKYNFVLHKELIKISKWRSSTNLTESR